jgi:hypothetical protein
VAIARRPSDRRLAVAIAAVAVVVVAAPIVAALIRALDAGYVVNGDQAIIAARASDVFTSRFPLVGGFSTVTYLVHERAYHPGPLLFWLLAVPARVHWSGALPVFMAAVNAASAAGVLLLARRRGGDGLMLATAAALVLTFGSLRTDVIRDVWNPSAAVVPFTLLIYLCWSLACGELKLLPLAVLVASFTMHCHVAYVTPSSLLLATGLVGLVLARRSGGGEPRSGRRWWIAAGLVALLCWMPSSGLWVSRRGGCTVRSRRSAGSPMSSRGRRWPPGRRRSRCSSRWACCSGSLPAGAAPTSSPRVRLRWPSAWRSTCSRPRIRRAPSSWPPMATPRGGRRPQACSRG